MAAENLFVQVRPQRGTAVRLLRQRLAFALLGLAALAALLPVALVFGLVVARGLPAISAAFLLEGPREQMRAGGIFPAIVGTLCLVAGTAAVALPLGVGSAIYLAEFARDTLATRAIRLAIVNLAGVPSVVFGLFGLSLFVILLDFRVSILSGALTLGLMVLPVIITASEEALLAVPQSLREASLALGATRWQTIRHAVLPHALPGILTGTILGIGRAAGETAPILFTAAAFFVPRLPRSVFEPVMALPYHLYVIATQVPNMPLPLQYGTALTLLLLVLGVNLVAILIRARIRSAGRVQRAGGGA